VLGIVCLLLECVTSFENQELQIRSVFSVPIVTMVTSNAKTSFYLPALKLVLDCLTWLSRLEGREQKRLLVVGNDRSVVNLLMYNES